MLKIGGIYRQVESENTDNHYFIIVDVLDSTYFGFDIEEDLPFANNQMIQKVVSNEVEYNLEDILLFSWKISLEKNMLMDILVK